MQVSDTTGTSAFVPEETVVRRRPFTQLCVYCQKVFNNWAAVVHTLQKEPKNGSLPSYGIEHLDSLGELKLSAAAGCNLCEQFINSANKVTECRMKRQLRIQKCNHPHTLEDWDLTLIVLCDESSGKGPDEVKRETLSYAICSLSLYSTSRQALIYESEDRSSISTQDALPIAKRWLDSCLASHKICNGIKNHHTPTRLLYLGGRDPCLSLVSERDKASRYATLSHCWGSLPFQTLKKDNLNAFQKRIPTEALTNTFQDAIYIARHLGLNYLWVDSLCIVQDDENDWRKEAALMSSVYGGSTINISASSARNGTFGCFQKRDSSWRYQIQARQGNEPLLFDCVQSSFRRSLLASPLVSRGWVLQERALSCRNLHFAQNEVFWECQERLACETFPEKLPACLDRSFRLLHRPLKIDSWGVIIEKYSSCELTYSKDKLIALSGLAKTVWENNKDEYVAGMWRKDLETQLLWFVYSPKPRISPYAAPSWSWASSRSPICASSLSNAPAGVHRKLATVQDIKIEHVSRDPFGEIKSANLRLCCQYFIRTTIRQKDELWYFSVEFAGQGWDLSCRFDCLDTETVESVKVYILPITLHLRNGTERFFGIMTEPTGEKKGQYRRVGEFSWLELEQRVVPTFIELCENAETQVDDSDYVEVSAREDGIKQYIIDMI